MVSVGYKLIGSEMKIDINTKRRRKLQCSSWGRSVEPIEQLEEKISITGKPRPYSIDLISFAFT